MSDRLMYEESVFSADLRGQERPVDPKLNGNGKKTKAATKVEQRSGQMELDLWS